MNDGYKIADLTKKLHTKTKLKGQEYTQFLHSEEILETICINTSSFFVIIDLTTMKYQYISPGIEYVMGFPADEFSKHGVNLIFELYHPDTRLIQKAIHNTVYKHLATKSVKQCLKIKFSYDMRLKHAKGHYIKLLQHNRILELDKNGKPLLMFAFCKVIDYYCTESKQTLVISKITAKGEKIELVKDFHPEFENGTLTRKEIEVWKLMTKNNKGKEIAEKLQIAVNTVNTHRKRIYKKLRNVTPL